MTINLETWDQTVSPHLQFIEAGSAMAARHARQLPIRPRYETKAHSELMLARRSLVKALENVDMALRVYEEKPIGE